MKEINQLIEKLEKQKRLGEKRNKEEERQSRRDEKRRVNEVKPLDTILRRVCKVLGRVLNFGIYEYAYGYDLTYEGRDERQKADTFFVYEWKSSLFWGFLHKKLYVYDDWDEHKDKILPALKSYLMEQAESK